MYTGTLYTWGSYLIIRVDSTLINSSFPGTIGHVAHGKSTVVKAISGVQVIILSITDG